jgi:hypothetical protein
MTMGDQLVADADHVQLARLVTEIAWRIDHGEADTVHELFVADGEMSLGQTILRGQEAIRQWGRERAAATYRTRHVCTGMRFVAVGSDMAEGTCVLTVYMHDGDGPGTTVPFAVGEDIDRYVRTDQGWRFTSRSFDQLFARPAH